MEDGWRVYKEQNWSFNGYLWKVSLIDILSRQFVRLERWGTERSDFPYCQVMCRTDELVGEMTEKLGNSEDDDLAHACMGIGTSGDFFELLMQIQSEGEVV